jgi:hypothetical protein
MKALKYRSFVGKLAGLFTVANILPIGDTQTGLIIFAVASLVKDAANRFGDLLDDGKPNGSFQT